MTMTSTHKNPAGSVAFLYVRDSTGKLEFLLTSPTPQTPLRFVDLFSPDQASAIDQHCQETVREAANVHTFEGTLDPQTVPLPSTSSTVASFYERAVNHNGTVLIQGAAMLKPSSDSNGTPSQSSSCNEDTQYLGRLLASKTHLAHHFFQPPRPTQNTTDIDSIVSTIADIFDTQYRHKPKQDQWMVGGGRSAFSATVRPFVERQLPIRMVLPAFPCKSPNDVDKVFGTMPDMGEALAFRTMALVNDAVRKVYPPGVKFEIVSDGHVFSDLLGVPDETVNAYNRLLRSSVLSIPGNSDIFSFYGLDDLLHIQDRASFTNAPTNFANDLPSIQSIELPRYLAAATTEAADGARRMLHALAGVDKTELDLQIMQEEHVTRLYRGFSKFLLTDLQNRPEMVALPSNNARKQLCSKIAKEMILRNHQYSAMVALLFPLHVRLSIHPHTCAGPKFGVNLIHDSLLIPQLSQSDRDASHAAAAFHIPTPWHNVTVQDETGRFWLTKKSRVRSLVAVEGERFEVVCCEEGRPSHYLYKGAFAEAYMEKTFPSFDSSVRASGESDISRVPGSVELPSATKPAEEAKDCNAVIIPATAGKDTKPANKEPYSAYSLRHRRCLLLLVALVGSFGPMAGNTYLPAMEDVRKDLGCTALQINLTVSMFMLTFAIAPLGWGSLADRTGRRNVYLISFAIYNIANILLGFTQSYAYLMALRIAQAIGASSVQSLGAGTIADLFAPTERGKAMGIFLLGPQLGPLVGPVIGGVLAKYAGWRWIFFFLAITGTVAWVLIFCFLPETLRATYGNGRVYAERGVIAIVKPQVPPPDPKQPPRPSYNPLAPLAFLRHTAVTLCICYIAIIFGSFYFLTVQIPPILVSSYGFDTARVGLAYIPLGAGFITGSTVAGYYTDRLLKAKLAAASAAVNGGETPKFPEIRIRSQWVGIILFPVGLLLFGIVAHFKWHLAALFVSLFFAGFGMTWIFSCNTTYLIDSYPRTPASVVALNSLFRNPAAAIGSAIADPVMAKAGILQAFVGLMSVDLVGSGLVIVVMVYGARWRLKARAGAPQTMKV
ncbi:dityrosine synthesis enzyme [Borealophlyctis nickersoniae]|nr:dityrosine synthesis enzyme [Borealophlyctis nickersoniae]